MGKGSQTTTNQTSSAPDPNAYNAYLQLLNRSAGVAATPYQGYGGPEVAPVNEQQQTGIAGVNAAAGQAQPGITAGFGQIQGSSQPLTASQIQQYQNPYTQQVINATQAEFNNQNAQQQSAVQGNAASQGALGGDRSAVAGALTAQQQQLAQAPVIAGLRNTGYNQAVQTAEQQQQTGIAGGQAMVGAAGAGQTAGLQGAGAQIGAGTLEQQTQQAQYTQSMQDYYQQQGYPFQVAQWLAGIQTGVGSQMGGTGTGSTTGPAPNPWTQLAGGALTAGALFAHRGGRISGFAGGGAPYGGLATSWVPTAQIHPGSGAPHPTAPSLQKPASGLTSDQMKGVGAIGKDIGNYASNYAATGDKDVSMSDLYNAGAGSDFVTPGLTSLWARGGRVKRYAMGGFAEGGDPTFDDRFGASFPNYQPTAGIGASTPAFDDRWSDINESTDVDPVALREAGMRRLGVVNPKSGDEFRLDPAATRQAMDETDAINGPDIASAKAGGNDNELPPEISRGASKPPAGLAGATDTAMAYGPEGGLGPPRSIHGPQEPPPEEHPSGGLLSHLGINMTPELRQGLLQAGLSMMATTRGGPGSFLGSAGEAGMAGVGAYNKSLQLTQEAEDKARKEGFEREKLYLPYNSMTAEQRYNAEHKGEMTDYQKSEEKRHQIDQAIKLKTPVQIGTSITGTPVMGLPRIDSRGNVALYPIDAQGNVSTTPIEPGGTTKPSAAAVSNAAETWKPDPKAAPGAPGSRNEAYLEQIRQEDSGQADAIKKAANYELDPAKYASMRRDQRQHFIDRVLRYDPNYNPQEVGLKYQAQRAFLPGTKNGDTITAFNTAISHLDTLKEMYHALNNGDVHTLNRLKNGFQQEFGYPAPNDVSALASIIGGEVVKATVGAQNALGDREEVRASISRDLSKMQADSVIDKYQKLMGGQLNARKFAYEQATGLHNFEDHFLQPRSQAVLKRVTNEDVSGGGAPTKPQTVIQNGHTYTLQPDGSYK